MAYACTPPFVKARENASTGRASHLALGGKPWQASAVTARSAPNSPATDARAYRDALGAFATGVTIVTTRDGDGEPVGVTASSFNSVSIDPPLVLWSLGRKARSRTAFCDSGHFAIHILAASQEDLSNRFAQTGADKFAGIDWQPGALGSPILGDHAAVFECATRHQYDGGDHIIMVGEVMSYEARDEAPLLFHGGRYAERRQRGAKEGAQPIIELARELANSLSNEDPAHGQDAEARMKEYATTGELADARRVMNWMLEELRRKSDD